MKLISEVSRELNIKPHQLHQWEQRGWLGYDPVLKDPQRNNQRLYDSHQMERIEFIVAEIAQQKREGITRTDTMRMEQKLLEKFGGLTTAPMGEMTILPTTADEWLQLFQTQTKEVAELKEVIMKSFLQEQAATKEQLATIQNQQEKLFEEMTLLRKEKAEAEAENKLFREKLDKAITYIQQQEEKEQKLVKKSFWSSFFGK